MSSAAAVALLTSPILFASPALAKPDPKDPVTRGMAPVEDSDWWYDALKIDQAHKQATGKGVKIALTETSIDVAVPELQGADLRLGENCLGKKFGFVRSPKGYDAAHGTSMAALLVGNGRGTDNGKGIRGVAPGATVQLFSHDGTPQTADGDLECVHAPEYFASIAAARPDIVSMSFATNSLTIGNEAIEKELVARGIVVVAGGGKPIEPAAIPGVVGVAPIDRELKPWMENFPVSAGTTVTAPGVGVGSGDFDANGWRSDVWHDGASDATPIVAGMLAVVKEKYPESTGNQLIQHLIHYTGRRPYSFDQTYGFGVASLTNMLKTSPTQWPDENPLLQGNGAAVEAYPMWASSLIDAPDDAGDKWARAERAAAAPADKGSAEQGAATGPSEDDGVPAAGLAGGAAVLAVVAAGALFLIRRSRGAAS